jgi:RNase adapter protein RapZ
MNEPQAKAEPRRASGGRVLVVTGMCGAGRATALKALEDMGYEAVDNLPLSLLPGIIGPQIARAPLAIGVDVRTRDFAVPALIEALDRMVAEHNLDLHLVFLDCDDELLVRRYTETRRRHPLAGERPVADGVRLDRQRVWPLRDRADLVIDTSALTPGDLKRLLHGHFARDALAAISVFITSFSYRHGLPRDADLVFDMRFLRNPHYVATLRSQTGRDPAVAAFIEADDDFARLFAELCHWLDELLPRYEREGKSYLTIAIGCTGGRHRSVFVAERLAAWFAAKGRPVGLAHRDLDRSGETVVTAAAASAQSMKDIA